MQKKIEKRHALAKFIVEYLYERSNSQSLSNQNKEEVLVEFSVYELKEIYEKSLQLFKIGITAEEVEDALFYLSRIDAIKIEGGFLIVYNRLTIDRIEKDNKKRYKNEDYQKLNQFYENKIQQIHIVGEYAKKMIHDYKGALLFVQDYFHLNYSSFLNKYFPGNRQNEIKKNITPAKFQQLFGSLSPTQLSIINDKESKYIGVLAGPGSGKTRVLVHKLASLLLMEDIKHEQLLMLTFSRAATTEFKKRLLNLIGNAANYVEIKTFHSYCFDLLGKVGSIERSSDVLKKAIEKIKNSQVEISSITKTVLVIDEAQDMDKDEFELVKALIDQNEEMRVIAVGDDDQNIYDFRGASSEFLEKFISDKEAIRKELIVNYRSRNNLVEFSNGFVKSIKHRLKKTPIISNQTGNGTIKLIHYQYDNLITPLVEDIISDELSGTTCVLTKTNEEASLVTGLLLKNGINAKLIQNNDSFNLYNLVEVRYFLEYFRQEENSYTILDDCWNDAKKEIQNKFGSSRVIDICTNLIRSFETANPKVKYKSDLEIFVRESKIEDFIDQTSEIVLVSTIHKSKGKEFDNVFILLENVYPNTDEIKRQLYVAMTRAKNNLIVHTNGNYLNQLNAENIHFIENKDKHPSPVLLSMQLYHEYVILDYFKFVQHRIRKMVSGDVLVRTEEGFANSAGEQVLKFSKKFSEMVHKLELDGYKLLQKGKVNFIVYWHKRDEKKEFKIILPEVCFEKIG